jgi:hypothetical protein
MADDQYPWTRRDNESTPAYAAFQVYLRGGARRSITDAAAEVGKAVSLLAGWSSKYGWVERVQAYDSHIMTAEVDGYAEQVSSVRSRHMEVTEALLDHLMINMRLWKPGQDPSIRWTQALAVALKSQQAAMTLREERSKGETGVIEKIQEALSRLEME